MCGDRATQVFFGFLIRGPFELVGEVEVVPTDDAVFDEAVAGLGDLLFLFFGLLVAMLAYQIMHVARRAMARATKAPWSLRRLRERVLRAGARLIISARRMTLILAATAAPYWAAIWPQIQMLRGADT